MPHPVFNYSNISQLTWFNRSEINQIFVKNSREAIVILKDKVEITINRNQLKPIIEEKRSKSSEGLQVKESEGFYLVKNPQKNTRYTVHPKSDHLFCNCSDYRNQYNAFESNQVACKHVFAVLGYLGFSSLKEYANFVDDQIAEQAIAHIEMMNQYFELQHGGY